MLLKDFQLLQQIVKYDFNPSIFDVPENRNHARECIKWLLQGYDSDTVDGCQYRLHYWYLAFGDCLRWAAANLFQDEVSEWQQSLLLRFQGMPTNNLGITEDGEYLVVTGKAYTDNNKPGEIPIEDYPQLLSFSTKPKEANYYKIKCPVTQVSLGEITRYYHWFGCAGFSFYPVFKEPIQLVAQAPTLEGLDPLIHGGFQMEKIFKGEAHFTLDGYRDTADA